jgi:hypothetical protein
LRDCDIEAAIDRKALAFSIDDSEAGVPVVSAGFPVIESERPFEVIETASLLEMALAVRR